jgi:uncharacterized Tic20 family protein
MNHVPRRLGGLALAINLLVAIGLLGLLGFWAALTLSPKNGSATGAVATFGLVSLWLFLGSYLAGGTLFLFWLYRARNNLELARDVASHWTPGWAVGAWFVPFANFVLGPLVLLDVARNSQPWQDTRGRRALGTFVWTWVIGWFVGNLFAAIGTDAESGTQLRPVPVVLLTVGCVLLALSAACISVVVARTTRAQHARFGFT